LVLACFAFEWCFGLLPCFVEVVVVAVVVVVEVVIAHGPSVSPCRSCAGHALTLMVIVTNGLVAECVW